MAIDHPWANNAARRIALALTLLVAAALLAAPSAMAGGQNPGANDPNPLSGQKWWDQQTKYNQTWNGYRSLLNRGRVADAAKVLHLARTPQFRWWGQWEKPLVDKLRGSFKTMDSQAPGQVPLIAVFGHQGDGCGPRYQGGGPSADARYRRWIDKFAEGIGSREAVLAFEPDSLGTVECLAKSRRDDRLRALAYGVKVLSQLPNATIYIDAGASDWQGARVMASKLRKVGVHRVRGFMLNATHQATTAENKRYGRDLSRRLGGKHFIINTSHNGNGAIRKKVWINRTKNLWRIDTMWCNPPNAAAGALPTTLTGDDKVDAYMWVERPGFSNGACNGGPARAGAWWEQRAIQMVDRSRWFSPTLALPVALPFGERLPILR